MNSENIKKLIKAYSIPIQDIRIERNLIKKSDELINDLGFAGKNILLVSDENLEEISNQIISNIDQNKISKLILKNVYADEKNAQIISEKCQNFDLILAVGSGTINDLCKLAAFQNNLPYIIFATAPSMNGYASQSSSILISGHKKSIRCQQAIAIYFDLEIISQAPERLIKAGIGDSVCYWTCQFDWMLSHLILNTQFNAEIFEILAPYQEKLINFAQSDLRDEEFIELLCQILLISGIGMYLCRGSYPASQGEHLIAHYLEMKYPQITKKYFHGEQIAVTTLTMLEIQDKFLKAYKINLKSNEVNVNYLKQLFNNDENLANQCLLEINKKFISKADLEIINQNLPQIQETLKKTRIPFEKMIKIYQNFDLPQTYKNLEIPYKIYNEAINNCHLIRDRLTALDFESDQKSN